MISEPSPLPERVDILAVMAGVRTPESVSVLLIEDDETIGQSLYLGLRAHGYGVWWARTGSEGLAAARSSEPDVLLLDLGLPDVDGVAIARSMRAGYPSLLIMILTARADDIDVVIGLDAGADDYLTKPFSLTVMLARLRAHLRTHTPASDGTPLRVGDLVLDVGSRRCLMGADEIALRPKEFDLLVALASTPGQALSRNELMSQVWDENWFGSTKTLDVTMASLRRRLADVRGARPLVITTLRRHGYRLEADPARSS